MTWRPHHPDAFHIMERPLQGSGSKIFYQIDFGADYATGTYGWSTNVDKIRRSVEWQLQCLKTDYIDYGFIHCLDEEEDWRAIRKAAHSPI